MAWVGLERYGYLDDAQRLAYRFLYMCVFCFQYQFYVVLMHPFNLLRMTTAFVDFNGVVPEKVCALASKKLQSILLEARTTNTIVHILF